MPRTQGCNRRASGKARKLPEVSKPLARPEFPSLQSPGSRTRSNACCDSASTLCADGAGAAFSRRWFWTANSGNAPIRTPRRAVGAKYVWDSVHPGAKTRRSAAHAASRPPAFVRINGACCGCRSKNRIECPWALEHIHDGRRIRSRDRIAYAGGRRSYRWCHATRDPTG